MISSKMIKGNSLLFAFLRRELKAVELLDLLAVDFFIFNVFFRFLYSVQYSIGSYRNRMHVRLIIEYG